MNTSSPRDQASYQALMGLVRVSGLLKKTADRFFSDFGLTQTQFNALMVLKYDFPEGCSQVELCRKLLVHPADVTGLVKRMLKGEFITKTRPDNDERSWRIQLSAKGKRILNKIEKPYYREVDSLLDIDSEIPADHFLAALENLENNLMEKILGEGR